MITLDITTTRTPPIVVPIIAMMRSLLHPPFGVGEGGNEVGVGVSVGVGVGVGSGIEDVGGLQPLQGR